MGYRNKYYEDLKLQAEERHSLRRKQLQNDISQANLSTGFKFECYKKDSERKQKEANLGKSLSCQRWYDKFRKTEEIIDMKKPLTPLIPKEKAEENNRKQRENMVKTQKHWNSTMYEQHKSAVDRKKVRKMNEKKRDKDMINNSVIEERKAKEIEVSSKTKKRQNYSIALKSQIERDQNRK